MLKKILLPLALVHAGLVVAAPAEIRIDLQLDASDYIVGERIRAVVDVVNSSPDVIGVGGRFRVWEGAGSNRVLKATYDVQDRLFVEVFRASSGEQLATIATRPFVADFAIETGEGQKLETFLADHYALNETSRFLAKPVLVHRGVRFEGQPRAFDIVEGVRAGVSLQMFSAQKDLQREFELVYWSKDRGEHLFLKARDLAPAEIRWQTYDLGPILRIDKPTLSILPSGEIVVLHRLNQDQFVRTEFWSLPGDYVYRSQMLVRDPATAGTSRVRELYKDRGVAPKKNPWWKFW